MGIPMEGIGYTYMLASKPYGTLYVGVTADLLRRMQQHRNGEGSRFVTRYDVTHLVWFERYDKIAAAIHREKQLKAWRRNWKIALIEQSNPNWCDLFPGIARP